MGTIVVDVAPPNTCFDPMQHFRSREGAAVLEFYQAGAILFAPEGSSPHHWWMTLADGHVVKFDRHPHISGALMEVSRTASAGTALATKVAPSHVRDKDRYAYDAAKMQSLCKKWAEAVRCAGEWSAAAGKFSKDFRGLSFRAMGLLRCLKRRYAICMHPELREELAELNQRGLLAITPEGGVRLSVPSTALPVEDGFSVFLRYLPGKYSDA